MLGPKQTITENKFLILEPDFPLDFGCFSRVSVFTIQSLSAQKFQNFAMESFVVGSFFGLIRATSL